MTTEQLLLFLLIGGVLGMLLWGRFRFDLVAMCGLLIGVLMGLVPEGEAFSGFSNPAVIIVALVLVASRAVENSGALNIVARWISNGARSVPQHIGLFGGIGAALSAVINNVAALAILMPLDVQAARKAGRPPGRTLMPLGFATILGGMVTLIGTPPNIVAAAVRADHLGTPYGMFDFTPVGAAVAIAGLIFVALIGWRLVPDRRDKTGEFVREASFQVELKVAEDSPSVGKSVSEIEKTAHERDVDVLGLMRGGRFHSRRKYGPFQLMIIEPGDLLEIQGATDDIAIFIKETGLQQAGKEVDEQESQPIDASADGAEKKKEEGDERVSPTIIEAVVLSDSWLKGSTARKRDLRRWYNVSLLGIAREGSLSREQIRDRRIEAGDVLLLSTRERDIRPTLELLGLLPVDQVQVGKTNTNDALLAVGIFAAAVAVAAAGWFSFTVTVAVAVVLYAALGLVPARDFYSHIDWSVVVMLAALLPIGSAFEEVGGTALMAQGIADLTAGASPVVALIAVMVVTMTLSDALNNVATMIITGPIAIDLAQRLGVNPDTFLMGAAVAASCAFLTPIGHKNNTLIMGPGGFRFGDYWRMGLPLEIVVLTVSVPMLLWVWPLYG